MAIGAFPVVKLGIMAFKQISKPIANVIKQRAKENLFFRQYVAMPPAHFYNWMEVKIRMWSLNMGRPATIPQLNEAMAIELGATLLGEVILFTVPAVFLVLEYRRQSKNELKKEEKILLEKLELVTAVNNIVIQIESQDIQLKRIKKILADLDSKGWMRTKAKKENSDESEELPLQLKKLPVPVSEIFDNANN